MTTHPSKETTQQLTEVIIPSFAAWFSFGKIHPIEEKVRFLPYSTVALGHYHFQAVIGLEGSWLALPEFFNNKNKSKTPQVYMDYRDFMINTYRLNPHEYLTVTACRRNLAGDVCAIIRVHAVLEQWGLLNYQVDPDSKPTAVVSADTPRGLQPLFPAVPASTVLKDSNDRVKEEFAATTLPSPSMLAKKDIYPVKKRPAEKEAEGDAKKVKLACGRTVCLTVGTCGVECKDARYHCTKQKLDICPPCYLEGRFPSSLFSGDFCKLTSASGKEEQWGDQETLLLLEGIEMYDDDWNKISAHVGKSADECILRFLKVGDGDSRQLPINDTFADIPMEKLGPLQYHRTPFTPADNPVLTLTSFLTSLVSPQIAQAAAQAAIAKIKGAEAKPPASPTKAAGSPTKTPASPRKDQANGTAAAGLEKAAATALGSAAAKSYLLAHHEELEMQKLTRVLIETQLKKMEI
ncbi:hypothetical protein HDU91_005139, partial [Kappamyces sp. JEL0680]